jgi:hypothetical protein
LPWRKPHFQVFPHESDKTDSKKLRVILMGKDLEIAKKLKKSPSGIDFFGFLDKIAKITPPGGCF